MGIRAAPPQGKDEVVGFGHLSEMDLAGNLLWRWDDVLDILRCFPNLVKVGLAGNRIGDVDVITINEPTAKEGEFDKIRALNLNGTNITSFRTVAWVGSVMPNLQELCLAHCDLSDLDSYDNYDCVDDSGGAADDDIDDSMAKVTLNDPIPRPISGVLTNLCFLDLSDCNIASWTQQVGRLARSLPHLTDLILNDNPVGVVEAFGGNADGEDCQYFSSLTTLQLTNADIASWSSIDVLNDFPNLKSLRFRNNPITSSISAAEARSVTIARLPKLQYLNASPIGDKERTDSERRYVSTVARELLMAETAVAAEREGEGKSNSDREEDVVAAAKTERTAAILANHPLFDQLTAKHQDAMAAARAAPFHGGFELQCRTPPASVAGKPGRRQSQDTVLPCLWIGCRFADSAFSVWRWCRCLPDRAGRR